MYELIKRGCVEDIGCAKGRNEWSAKVSVYSSKSIDLTE